ncbi:sigma-70 family RNA polymerase sigma factor [Exiguobacterium aurantiacum]|uniref:Sigma-70 family RNA polymerase sigma factor n=1 Tax=Exiguobacterium aurantiacum TaxID=33987 RepID=A0ABY5FTL4_9BACL|nr:sigma-70 family RNA polymerase sigma factor [Exiguobacterium aurantiacum]UTT44567.1 sigma-70 family RNA polymerase sigma factor [Exiguobacterium aurantiacum]
MIKSLFLKRFITNNFDVNEKLYLPDVKQKLVTFLGRDSLNIDDLDLIEFLKDAGFNEIEIQKVTHKKDESKKVDILEDEDEEEQEELTLDLFFDTIYDSDEHLKKAGDFRDNRRMLELYHNDQKRDATTFEKLVRNNQHLVKSVAAKYLFLSKSLTLEDLINEGNFGLMKAIEKFDLSKDNSFSTYAFIWIRQSITRAIADKSNMIRIPVHAIEKINKLNRIEREIEAAKSNVNIQEVCQVMEITEESYYRLKEIQYRFLHEVSLNSKITVENENDEIIDFIPAMDSDFLKEIKSIDDIILLQEVSAVVHQEINKLSERERDIIALRFGLGNQEPQTLEQVGKIMGVTRERIRQIEAKVLRKLRKSHYLTSIQSED